MTNKQLPLALRTIRQYWWHAWHYKLLTIGVIVTIPIAMLCLTYLPPIFLANILRTISEGNTSNMTVWEAFGNDLGWYIGLTLLGGIVLWRIAIICIWSLEMRVIRDMMQRMFTHVLSQSMDFHSNRFGGSLVSQTNKFASAYVRFADGTIFDLYPLFLSFIFAFAVLYPRVPVVAVGMMVFSFSFMAFSVWLTHNVRLLRIAGARAENRQTGFLADAITNVLTAKSFVAEKYEHTRFAKATEDVRTAERNIMWASVKRDTAFAVGTISLGVGALVAALVAYLQFDLQIDTVFLVITYTGLISQKLWEFAQHIIRNYNKALGDAEEMTKILELAPSIREPAHPEKSIITRGAIAFNAMSFTHAGADENVLFKNLNLSIEAGTKVGLVGHSGSGKTTLSKLIIRFMDVDEGEITIDGQNISAITQEDLRQNIAYAPQEPLLFHRSIRENISYGKRNASNDEIETAAKKANAHEFILKLPNGYDTLVGERGVKLSGGQRQRVAIARAILKDAPVLLLDEATSALDSESEKLIQDSLGELMKNRTSIVIAHRLSTIAKMDRIIVLDNGTIKEDGTHKELLEKNGIYANLWSHQSGGFIEE